MSRISAAKFGYGMTDDLAEKPLPKYIPKQYPLIRSLFAVATCLLAFLSALTAVGMLFNPSMFHALICTLALLIVVAPPAFQKHYDLFSPWSFVILAVLTGCTLQGYAITLLWPDPDYIETAILMEESPQYFYYPSAVFLSSLVCLALGYFLAQRLPDREYRYRRVFSAPRLVFWMLVSVVAATAATFLYVRNTGGMSIERISDKRAVISSVDVAGDTELQQYGPLRQVSKIGAVGFLTLLSYILSRKRSSNPLMLILLLILFAVSFILPFYSSNRSDVVWLFIGAVGIAWYHQVSHFWFKVVFLSTCAVGLFVVMSFLRHTDTSSVAEKASVVDAFRSLILNRNGPSLAKTGHIINNVPDVLDYQYGKTIAIWLLAPIPRSIYPNKPLIHSGPIIGTEIYKTKVSGVPPGLVGEMYWNFHLAGTVIGVALVGFMMGWIHKRFWQLNKNISVLAPLYMFSVAEIGYSILGHSVGFGLFIKLIDFLMAAILILLCTRKVYKDID